jgi:hypothetical protein
MPVEKCTDIKSTHGKSSSFRVSRRNCGMFCTMAHYNEFSQRGGGAFQIVADSMNGQVDDDRAVLLCEKAAKSLRGAFLNCQTYKKNPM